MDMGAILRLSEIFCNKWMPKTSIFIFINEAEDPLHYPTENFYHCTPPLLPISQSGERTHLAKGT